MATLKGGEKLNAALKEMATKLENPGTLRVGFLEGARYPDGKPVAMIAAIQEFGAPARNIPPRPFFRNMIAAESDKWPKGVAALLKANDYDLQKTFVQFGSDVSGALRQSITELWEPPLAASTIRRKGSAKPLIDSGLMLNSVNFEIKT